LDGTDEICGKKIQFSYKHYIIYNYAICIDGTYVSKPKTSIVDTVKVSKYIVVRHMGVDFKYFAPFNSMGSCPGTLRCPLMPVVNGRALELQLSF
jgi:hypothetical protein